MSVVRYRIFSALALLGLAACAAQPRIVDGNVVVSCSLSTTGINSDCHVSNTTAPRDNEAALDYVTHARYPDGFRPGATQPEPYAWFLTFRPGSERALSVLVQPDRSLNRPPLIYPARMIANGVEGSADITCTMTPAGPVKDCVVDKATNSVFADAALDHVRQTRYRPVLQDGVPVEHRRQWTITFKLG